MPKPAQKLVPISMPIGGLDENSSFAGIKPPFTAACLNVRPTDCREGRRRISRRPGFSKYITTQFANASIQNLFVTQVALDETAGTGDVFSVDGSTGGNYLRVYSASAGATQMTSSTGMTSTHNLGCVDENNVFYSAASNGTTIEVRKIATDYAESWTKSVTLAVSNTIISGIACIASVVYVNVQSNSGTPGDSHGIYRFDADTGAQLDGTPWLRSLSDSFAYVISTTTSQQIAIGGGILAVAGRVGGALVLQQWSIETKTLSHTTTLQSSFAHYQCKVVTDAGANFYVLTETLAAASSQLYKITWSGEIPSTFNAGAAVTISGTANKNRDIAYDPVGFQIAVVGKALGGTTDSIQFYSATTGVRQYGGQPLDLTSGGAGVAEWNAVSTDGIAQVVDSQSVTGIRLRRNIASGSVDIASYVGPSGQPDVSAANYNPDAAWVVTSGLNTTTERLWLVCSGLNVVPTLSSMQSSRITRALAVVGGSLYDFSDLTPTLITSSFLSGSVPVVRAALGKSAPSSRGLTIYYTDGSKYGTYNVSTQQTGLLVATAGSLPSDPNGRICELVVSWRGRIIWAGLKTDPQNAFASAQDNPTDYFYNPNPYVSTQAWAFASSPCGLCPDKISGLIPYNDDTLILGCNNSIWQMSGDPAAGGRFDLLSDITGMAFGNAWCKDSAGIIYFMGSRGAVFRMIPGQKPDRISDNIDSARLFDIQLDSKIVSMVWDDRWKHAKILVSPTDATLDAEHYLWDSQSDQYTVPNGSWWVEKYPTFLNATAVCVSEGDAPGDRTILYGGRNGYIYVEDNDGKADGTTAIESYVDIGPIRDSDIQVLLTDLRFILGANSGKCQFTIRSGQSAEAAFHAEESPAIDLSPDRNYSQAVRSRGHAHYVRVSSTAKDYLWCLESLYAMLQPSDDFASRRW